MVTKKVIILGAGPSGLAVANSLIHSGLKLSQIIILEKESEVGGLCRSISLDDAPLDIGGGHFLDTHKKDALDFLFQFMPREEWDLYNRISKIRLRGTEIDHPLEANLWQFPTEVQVDYLESIAQAGSVRGDSMPQSFAAWITWKLGKQIATEYMLPYNRKIWSMDPDKLGTYWLYKLPNVSFRETLQSCLEGHARGALPAHATFLYPKEYGYGEVWRRMGERLGESLITNCSFEHLDLKNHIVNEKWQAETIISTIPWTIWPNCCELPGEIFSAISSLKKVAIDIEYHSETLNNKAHWIYEPAEDISYHRLLLRSNFIKGARGYWTETNTDRFHKNTDVFFHNDFSYPVNTLDKPEIINKILRWAHSHDILGLGRWGRWEHINSDIAVAEALQMTKELIGRFKA